jgi:Ca-activated chloride channel family protein
MLKIGAVSFLWPTFLWLLAAVPLVAALHAGLVARRRRVGLRYANLETVGAARSTGKLAQAPALLMLLGLTALIVAIARPQALIALPARLETVILALDISGSMKATDIAPNRIMAAQAAAKTFVAEQPSHVRIGVVGIAASAAVVQSPTNNREEIVQAIDRLETQRGTALGSGLVIALDAALPSARIDVEEFMNPRPSASTEAKENRSEEESPQQRGIDATAAIVLLSDGQSNVGPGPLKAAEIAAKHGVRIYTVGIGTPEGTTVTADGWSMRTRLDEESLKKVASMTQAEYFRAGNAADLKKIYSTLGTRLVLQKPQPTEVTAIVAALGAVLALAGGVLSMLWFNRIL